jgi:hypothetical protein
VRYTELSAERFKSFWEDSRARVSHEICPEIGEYERTSTTVADFATGVRRRCLAAFGRLGPMRGSMMPNRASDPSRAGRMRHCGIKLDKRDFMGTPVNL